MKKAAMLLFIFMIAGVLTQKQVYAGGVTDFEVVRGNLVMGADGSWELVGFFVTTKSGKMSIPVLSVRVQNVTNKSGLITEVDFSTMEINKRTNEYSIDLNGLDISGDFNLLIELDISELVSGIEDGGDSGPGPIPNETVLVIKYP